MPNRQDSDMVERTPVYSRRTETPGLVGGFCAPVVLAALGASVVLFCLYGLVLRLPLPITLMLPSALCAGVWLMASLKAAGLPYCERLTLAGLAFLLADGLFLAASWTTPV